MALVAGTAGRSSATVRPTPTAGQGPRPRPRRRRPSARTVRTALTAYGLLAPALLLFGVFLLVPIGLAFVLSAQDSTGIGTARFVGADNYLELLTDPVFWRSFANTVVLAVVTVPASIAAGLGVALLLTARVPGRAAFRALFYAPVVISGVVIAMMGRWIFDENVGIVNKALALLGVDAVRWQSDGTAAFVSIMVVLVWARLGFCMVVYLAGLQAVPGELYEAAELDGATRWQRFRHVTLPLLAPTTFFLVVMMVIETFHVFDIVYVMTGGGPGNATQLLVTYAFQAGFDARREGYGAAVGVIVFVVMLVATALWWRGQRGREADV